MNKKGFVTSALLYGILSLFIILILGTISIVANRKLTLDKIKQSALDDVQNVETNLSCFVINGGVIEGYNLNENGCNVSNIIIPKTATKLQSLEGIQNIENIESITIYSSTEVAPGALDRVNSDNLLIYIKKSGSGNQNNFNSTNIWPAGAHVRMDL